MRESVEFPSVYANGMIRRVSDPGEFFRRRNGKEAIFGVRLIGAPDGHDGFERKYSFHTAENSSLVEKIPAVCQRKPVRNPHLFPSGNGKRFSFRQKQIRSYVYTGIFRESVVQFL